MGILLQVNLVQKEDSYYLLATNEMLGHSRRLWDVRTTLWLVSALRLGVHFPTESYQDHCLALDIYDVSRPDLQVPPPPPI